MLYSCEKEVTVHTAKTSGGEWCGKLLNEIAQVFVLVKLVSRTLNMFHVTDQIFIMNQVIERPGIYLRVIQDEL